MGSAARATPYPSRIFSSSETALVARSTSSSRSAGEAGEGLFEPFDRGQANGGYGLFAFFGEHGFHDAPVFGVAALRHEPLLLKVRHSAGHVLF